MLTRDFNLVDSSFFFKENLLTDYLANNEANEALTAFKEMYAPKK